MDGWIQITRLIAFGALVFLPGAWVSFGLPLRDLSFSIRLITGAVLGPLVIYLQFYALRLLGASFEVSTILLVILNLPVLYLMWTQFPKFSLPERRAIVLSLLVLIVVIASLAPQFSNTQKRAYSGHGWMHTDTIYMIANGELIPEDPQLAGVRLSYPWVGHIYQAILSYLLNSAPVSNYIWTNLLWLIFIAAFASLVVAELGGKQLARSLSVIWLLFGINFLGYIVGKGDIRYTPWMSSFLFFNQMPFALGMFIALIFFLIRSEPAGVSASFVAIILSLSSGIGLVYPILFPPVCAVIGARLIAVYFESPALSQRALHREICLLGIVLIAASVLTFTHFKLVTHDRVGETILLAPLKELLGKARNSVLLTLPFLIGLIFVFRSCWKERPRAIVVLALGAIASCLLYVILRIPNWWGEYKFILTAGVCLAPFPSLALESLLGRPERALPTMVFTILILGAPFVHKFHKDTLMWLPPTERPVVNTRSFDLRLSSENSLSPLCDAIRQKSPINSILVLDHEDYHFPTLTRRTLYIPPSAEQLHPGVNMINDYLLTGVKGYNSQIVKDRRSTVRSLFDSGDSATKVQSLKRILELNRPVGIILADRQHASLLEWLARSGIGRSLYRANHMTLWLVEPNEL